MPHPYTCSACGQSGHNVITCRRTRTIYRLRDSTPTKLSERDRAWFGKAPSLVEVPPRPSGPVF